MRLNVFIKSAASLKEIPLDIIDDRPCQQVLADIVVIEQLPINKGQAIEQTYALCQNDKTLDLKKTLTENKIHNGDLLFVVLIPAKTPNLLKPVLDEAEHNEKFESKESEKNLAAISNNSIIPGKKIDFD